jgi:hypothetical protein
MPARKRDIEPEIAEFLAAFWDHSTVKGMSLRDGARLFGCPLSTWSRIVNGNSEPHASVYLRMKRWLDGQVSGGISGGRRDARSADEAETLAAPGGR